MTTKTLPRAMTELVDQIVERFQPRQIILFGSHAADTADAGSDVDLLVVMETSQAPIRQAVAMYQAIDHTLRVDLLVRTPEQVSKPNPRDVILRAILNEGVTVYEARH